MIIIIMGKPGSGKGVQSGIVAEKYKMHHISTGELFRQHMKNNTPLGKKIRAQMESGKLVSDEDVEDLINYTLNKLKFKDIILDGYPRTIPQAVSLNSKLRGKEYKVILIEVSDETALKRMEGRQKVNPRPESSREAMLERIDSYKKLTAPITQKYEEKKVLYRVDGEEPIEKVTGKIFQLINNN